MALVTSVMRVQQLLISRVDAALKPHGVTFARFEVLMLLSFSRAGRLPLSKIGQRLQVHPASVTNAIDRLEADGMVRRVEHPSDKRTTLAAMTPAGRRVAARAAASLNTQVFEQVGIDGAPLAAITSGLTALRRGAGDFE